MNQQQLTESQLPIDHKLIETETKFRNAQTANKSTEETRQIQLIEIISPFLTEIVKSAENLAIDMKIYQNKWLNRSYQ